MQIVVDDQNAAHHGLLAVAQFRCTFDCTDGFTRESVVFHISAANSPGCLPSSVNMPTAAIRDEATAFVGHSAAR
jgi:hypothetical protein